MFFADPSIAATVRWFKGNATAVPLAAAALVTLWLSAAGVRPFYQFAAFLLLWMVAGGLALVLGILSLWVPRLRPGPSNARLALVSIALSLSVVLLNWPLRLTFLASRPALERVAADVRAGREVSVPRRAGLFTIERAEIPEYTKRGTPKTGVVCLWTEYDPAGSAGFVQCAPDEGYFNIQSEATLTPCWQFIAED